MLLLRRPKSGFVKRTIERQQELAFTYEQVGATSNSSCPDGFRANHYKSEVGKGWDEFQLAQQAVQDLQMLHLGWIQPVQIPVRMEPRAMIATLVRVCGVYALNVARVVFVEQTEGRFSFGYGTLPEYTLCGEERFTITCDRATERVEFEIYSFARPCHWWLRAAGPFVRRLQGRFCRDSSQRLRSICQSNNRPAANLEKSIARNS